MKSQLVLKSKEVFSGISPNWQNDNYFGEVVFSTGMTGYVEALTDPSYCNQILVFTYPLIGNYGIPIDSDWESKKIHVKGVVVSEACEFFSHYDAKYSFKNWLKSQNVALIEDVDTRELTKRIRSKGAVLGAIACNKKPTYEFIDPNTFNLIKKVSCKKVKILGQSKKRLIVIDCGIKQNILRNLLKYPLQIKQVPYNYDFTNEAFDAVFISNGPGDPAKCKETIAILSKALKQKKPTFGICLGSQLIACAIGAKTYKLKFGHRSHNQPCYDYELKKAVLTSQNHGYAIDESTLPFDWSVYFKNLNDNSVEGIKHNHLPFFGVQFHPESSPGPVDTQYLFDKFYELI